MNDVMIDFETLGNGKNKCLCQIGAVYFDRISGELGTEFKANIDARTHTKYGGQLDADTVYWWLKQSDNARVSIMTEPLQDIKEVMTNLNIFLSTAKRIWSHATFDFVTLQETLKQLEIKPLFKYSSGLDLRTLTYLGKVKVDNVKREGTHHDALDDCKHQVKYAVASLNSIQADRQLLSGLKKLNI